LDEDTEKSLAKLTKMTGMSISEVLKHGVYSFKTTTMKKAARKPYDIYKNLDLGAGGHALVKAKDAKTGVVAAIKRKHSK
jgi:hypothetical protein